MNLFVESALVLTAILVPGCNNQNLVAEVDDSASFHPAELETVLDHHRTAQNSPRQFPYDLGKKDITSKYYLACSAYKHATASTSQIINL